ncbi:hypothetical protein [Caballeronia sordidicola]|nr:hypothetical protein [Caballeronia sordidicola]
MTASKKRKQTHKGSPPQRHSKGLFLPMVASDADAMILGVRIALESIRRQSSGRSEAVAMAQALLLTTYVTEAGHGALAISELTKAEVSLNRVLVKGAQTGDWTFPGDVVAGLAAIVNEHDRQLHEVRSGVILQAMQCMRRLVDKAPDAVAGESICERPQG